MYRKMYIVCDKIKYVLKEWKKAEKHEINH